MYSGEWIQLYQIFATTGVFDLYEHGCKIEYIIFCI